MRFLPMMACLTFAVAAPAQTPAIPPRCEAPSPSLPAGFGDWSRPRPLLAGTDRNAATRLQAGRAAILSLHPARDIGFARPPEKPGDGNSHGGIVAFEVQRAGTYRIGLSAGAWIDVVRDGQAIASSAHGHGPACSGIRKIVDFRLQPGPYLLQIAGSAEPAITAMLVAPR